MTKLAPEWVRTSDPVIRSPARYRWTTAPPFSDSEIAKNYKYKHTKNTVILNNIIQPQLKSTTANHINATPFTLGVDAGTDEVDEKLLPLTVRYMDDQGGKQMLRFVNYC